MRIEDDDETPRRTVNFGAASYTVAEGGTVTVTVTLDGEAGADLSVRLSASNQGTTSDDDYSGVPTSVEFKTGESQKTFIITAVDDSEDDDGETFRIAFLILNDEVIEGTVTETTITITDNDQADITVSPTSSSPSTRRAAGPTPSSWTPSPQPT